MGKHFIGPDELRTLSKMFPFSYTASEIQFSEDILRTHAKTHILIFAPQMPEVTVNWFRDTFGTDPSKEPCMYAQDWYLKEEFASKETLDGKWHLIRKEVMGDARAKRPEDIEQELTNEKFPTAVLHTFTFFVWHLLKGEKLWRHDFVWCSDRDHNSDRIYVGRYEDPTGVNKNGFNIHRHLSLRPSYSAAPEITS